MGGSCQTNGITTRRSRHEARINARPVKTDLEIECAGEQLLLLLEKAVFWPREKTLLVADMHFGKPAAFRRAGLAAPESTTAHDLERLDRALLRTGSARLIILGDFFHSAAGRQPEMMEVVQSWREKQQRLKITLVPGNHDKRAGPPPLAWNVQSGGESCEVPPFLFCHEPKEVPGHYVLSGHIHPAISLHDKFGPGLRAPCFCFGRRRAILPAFGTFTGMHNLQRLSGERIFAIGDDQIIELPG